MLEFQESLSAVVARAATVGGRVPGFWSRYAVEQVCLVGSSGEGLLCTDLIGRGIDCLGLRIWTQQ